MNRPAIGAVLLSAGLFACGGETDQTDPDLLPPTVSVTSPTSGMRVTGVLGLSAVADDSSGIAGVVFRVDGAPIGPEDKSPPFGVSWNSATVADGSHSITAAARDSAGNIATSTGVQVMVDNTAPTVALTSPSNAAKVAGLVALTATATDAGGVAGVTFKVDGVALGGEDTSLPFSTDWNTALATEGVHSVTATARDSAGRTTTTPAISVTVDNVPLGTLRVTLSSGGNAVLLDSLHVVIDSGALGPVRPRAAFPLDSLVPPGAHTVRLAGLDPHCALTGPATQAVRVAADSVTTVSFGATCGYGDVIAIIVTPLDSSVAAIQLRRPDGSLVGTPVRSGTYMFDVALSPDGRRLAYVTGIVLTTVHLHDLITGTEQVLVPLGGQVTRGMVAWSPDGTQLAYRDTTNGLAILTLASGLSVSVPNGQQANAPDWSRDGLALAFTGIRDTNQSVFRVAPNGTAFTQLTFPPTGTGDTEARWSPDGTKLLLASTRDGSPAVWLSDADGGNIAQVTPGGAIESFPHWSPAGDRIAFIRGNSVWVRNLASGAESLVFAGGSAEILGIDWAR